MKWIHDIFNQFGQIDWQWDQVTFPMFENFRPFEREQDFVILVVALVAIILVIIAQPKS